MAPVTLNVALWAVNIAHKVASLQDWLALVDAQVHAAAQTGADVFVLPEYPCYQWLHFAPQGMDDLAIQHWLSTQTPQLLPAFQNMARRHGVAVMAGSYPWAEAGVTVNRAWFFTPDGEIFHQDKLTLTPYEQHPWQITPGTELRPFQWRGVSWAILICLDSEQPALSAILVEAGIDALLVPSYTEQPSGYHRVFTCAKARAIELCAPVVAVGNIGTVIYEGEANTNVSGAALFIPAEMILGANGCGPAIDMAPEATGPGQILQVSVPIGQCRKLRQNGAEVWCGSSSAEHKLIAL